MFKYWFVYYRAPMSDWKLDDIAHSEQEVKDRRGYWERLDQSFKVKVVSVEIDPESGE